MYEVRKITHVSADMWLWTIAAPEGAIIRQQVQAPCYAAAHRRATDWCEDRNRQLTTDRRFLRTRANKGESTIKKPSEKVRRKLHAYLKERGKAAD